MASNRIVVISISPRSGRTTIGVAGFPIFKTYKSYRVAVKGAQKLAARLGIAEVRDFAGRAHFPTAG